MLSPRGNAFISDCKEKYLPNAIVYSAWNVFSFLNKGGSSNPFLRMFQELNWSFIVTIIISFAVLLFTFDTISGEKEFKTLSLTLSNSFSRGILLLGKYISAITTAMIIIILGMILSALIVLFSNQVNLLGAFIYEMIGFLIIAFFLVACMAAFGLFSSVIVKNSNVSLLLALTFWLFFAVVIPNSSTFIAKNIFSIEHEEAIQEKISRAYEDLDKNAPKGSWAMNSNNPFSPQHELRANLKRKRLNAEKSIRDAYYQDMFRQFERTRLLTAISPVTLFEYMIEAVVGGGYVRFRKVWSDMHVYQGQFLSFFKNIDAQDKDSPHWFNPHEDVSTTRKPVAFEEVPLFEEKSLSLPERISSVIKYLIINVVYICVIFLLTFVLFVRYDVR
jgi:ABC-type transport system involved in multi-copper enzyme maturation permease subunit